MVCCIDLLTKLQSLPKDPSRPCATVQSSQLTSFASSLAAAGIPAVSPAIVTLTYNAYTVCCLFSIGAKHTPGSSICFMHQLLTAVAEEAVSCEAVSPATCCMP